MTKMYVEKMCTLLTCDALEIKPKNDIKVKGFKSYVVGGRQSMFKEAPELVDYDFNVDDYDMIIFASPVWAYTYAPAMRTFFTNEIIQGKKVSYFSTHRGGPGKVSEKFELALTGNEIIAGTDVNTKYDYEKNAAVFENWVETIHTVVKGDKLDEDLRS